MKSLISILLCLLIGNAILAQTTMPPEHDPHEGTWIQWPHNNLFGWWYQDEVSSTFIEMSDALQEGEMVHIVAYDSLEINVIQQQLSNANVPLTNIDFFVQPNDDVWVRDNGPMFVYDADNNLKVLDWGFNGWGDDAPFDQCDDIPQAVGEWMDVPVVDLNAVVLEGGAI
ncbi:MAG: agmatine deiminase family protein, partial [Bacteroidota bacterium]